MHNMYIAVHCSAYILAPMHVGNHEPLTHTAIAHRLTMSTILNRPENSCAPICLDSCSMAHLTRSAAEAWQTLFTAARSLAAFCSLERLLGK